LESILIENGEPRPVAEQLDMGPQHARCNGMEGADPHPRPGTAQLDREPRPHFPRGLVGEGQGKDPFRLRDTRLDEVGNPHRQHAGLAAAGAREDQERSLLVGHGLALGRIQGEDVHAAAGNHSQRVASFGP
jgi:hypothetical protein